MLHVQPFGDPPVGFAATVLFVFRPRLPSRQGALNPADGLPPLPKRSVIGRGLRWICLFALNAEGRRTLAHRRYSADLCGCGTDAKPLLEYVRQLVRQKPLFSGSVGSVLAGAEHYVVPQSECPGLESTSGIISTGTSMNTDLTEVLTEA